MSPDNDRVRRAPERVRHGQSAKHPEYPLEGLCIHLHEPFQLAFARQAQQLFEDRDEVGLVASHQGLTIRAETEDAIGSVAQAASAATRRMVSRARVSASESVFVG